MPFTSILGVDCATKPNRVGVARARWLDGSWLLTETHACSKEEPPAAHLTRWIGEDPNALIALDAPLGWPVDLPRALSKHHAGDPIDAEASAMFTRATDRFLIDTIGQRPLEVGADRIARTAVAALGMLQQVRDAVDEPVPLAWSPEPTERPAAIEVYPAGTLKAHGLHVRGYKRPGGDAPRDTIGSFIQSRLANHAGFDAATDPHDVVDAVLCVIAGLDFLTGDVYAPEHPTLAGREGWIWVRRREAPA